MTERPQPPEFLFDLSKLDHFTPAFNVGQWVTEALLAEESPLYNPDHDHLHHAKIGYLWTNAINSRRGKRVIGQAEDVTFRCGKWQKARQEQQIKEWFDIVPDFIITLDAVWCRECTDVDFCALVDHELYHFAQERGPLGEPVFYRGTGLPKITITGHDVEEFVGVVRRYGIPDADEPLSELVKAANSKPEISPKAIATMCGTCSR